MSPPTSAIDSTAGDRKISATTRRILTIRGAAENHRRMREAPPCTIRQPGREGDRSSVRIALPRTRDLYSALPSAYEVAHSDGQGKLPQFSPAGVPAQVVIMAVAPLRWNGRRAAGSCEHQAE